MKVLSSGADKVCRRISSAGANPSCAGTELDCCGTAGCRKISCAESVLISVAAAGSSTAAASALLLVCCGSAEIICAGSVADASCEHFWYAHPTMRTSHEQLCSNLGFRRWGHNRWHCWRRTHLLEDVLHHHGIMACTLVVRHCQILQQPGVVVCRNEPWTNQAIETRQDTNLRAETRA